MPTTPLGIWYPGSSDAVTPLETTFSTMASSIDNVLAGNVQIHRVDNITQRNALVSQFPPSATNPLVVWRADATNGQELEYTKNGTTWHYVSTSEDGTGWVNVPLRSGFTNNVTLQVRRLGEHIYCKGRVAGSFTTGNVIIGDIPVGFRPVGTVHRPALSFNTNAAVIGSAAIGTDGTFNVSASTAGSYIVNVFTQWLAS